MRLSDPGEALASISARRHMEPAKLSKLMRGELDWIVMKTLEKDRNRRYETATGFAMDVQRYLADEPVQACPPSPWYRLRKFVRRNRRSVSAASLSLLALVVVVIGTTWGLIRAEQQRHIVERQRNELAERNQALRASREHERLLNERARQAIEAVTSEAAIEQLTREKVLRPEQKDFLDKMIRYYAESTQDGAATEQERSRQARAYGRMGRMNQVLGRSQGGENAYRRAVALGKQLVADFPDRSEHRQGLAYNHINLGVLLKGTGRPTEAEAAYVEALAEFKQLAADFPDRPEFRQALAATHSNLGNSLHTTGRLKAAEAAHDEGLAIRRQLVADFPARYEFRGALASSLNNIGYVFQTTERPKEATAAYAESMAIYKQLVTDFPDRPEFRLGLAKSHSNLAGLLVGTGRPKEAEAGRAESMAIFKQLVADFPNRPEFRHELADGYNAMGKLLGDTGRLKEAEAAFAEALALFKRLAAESPEFPDYSNNVAGRLLTLAKAACMRRDFAAARRLVEEALPYQQAAIQANPRDPDYRQYYRNNLGDLAQSCASQGDRPAALAAAAKLHDLGWDPASDAFAAAWTLARCVAAVEKVDKLDEAMRRAEMQFYADQAMAMVRDAVAKGYKNAAYMKTDKGLDPLREREDFKKVVAELEAAKEAPPKKP
jgi:tetratricopeptide (TPR) repeat protein